MTDVKSAEKTIETSPPNRLAGLVSTGCSVCVMAVVLMFAGADGAGFEGRDPGSSLGRWLAIGQSNATDTATAALLPPAGTQSERGSSVFSAAAPLLAVPAAAGAARLAAGKSAPTSSVVRTIETASVRADAVVPPIKRVRPATPSSPVVTTVPTTPAVNPVVTTQVAAAPAPVPADRSKLTMQPYGLGAGNMARAATAGDKPVAKAKVVCKANQQFDKSKDTCVKRVK
jgi:hypothetical protein